MDLPLCKICGERHRLGFCPKFGDPASERRRWLRAMTGPARAEPVATVTPQPVVSVKLPNPVQRIEADHQREDGNPNREVGGVHGLSPDPIPAPKAKFDKRAYQRELMRTRRAKAKEAAS
jgi:hypothetical protein